MRIFKVLQSLMNKIFKAMAHLIGPFLFILILLLPLNLEINQKKFLAIFTFVVSNWLLTSFPLFVTGFIGVGLTVLMGVSTAKTAFTPFSSSIIFLFLGGFLFAKAMNESRLDKRISLWLLSRSFLKGSFKRIIIALLCLTAFFSMWVSNTATTAMMLPITLGILASLNINDKKITTVVLLGVAYSASIGGLATPIGSIPNIVSVGLLAETANIHISFIEWIAFGLPIVILFLVILCYYIFKRIPGGIQKFDNRYILRELESLPKFSKNEFFILVLFILTVFFWFFPSFCKVMLGAEDEVTKYVSARFNSGIVAIFFSSFLFIFPLGAKRKILKQSDIKTIDWPSLLLFGTGLSLGKVLFDTGLANILGSGILSLFSGSGVFTLLTILIFFTIFATEVASNTATASILIPIVIAMSISLNQPPIVFVIAIALACSLAFMLPVATPPNAIVYGSEKVEMGDMMRIGFKLNLIFGALLSLGFYGAYKVFF
jgi:sodium-dependent dicarboxylate transporter 2/3/5